MPPKDDIKSPLRLLRLPEVRERTGHPTSVIYSQISRKEFPRPVPIGARSVGWVEAEIEAWIRDRIAARDRVST
jgi:prophage regulatory protein